MSWMLFTIIKILGIPKCISWFYLITVPDLDWEDGLCCICIIFICLLSFLYVCYLSFCGSVLYFYLSLRTVNPQFRRLVGRLTKLSKVRPSLQFRLGPSDGFDSSTPDSQIPLFLPRSYTSCLMTSSCPTISLSLSLH